MLVPVLRTCLKLNFGAGSKLAGVISFPLCGVPFVKPSVSSGRPGNVTNATVMAAMLQYDIVHSRHQMCSSFWHTGQGRLQAIEERYASGRACLKVEWLSIWKK